MRRSEDRILTTHTGSLPRPPQLTDLLIRRARGESVDPAELDRLGHEATRWAVRQQAASGIDIGNNGEQQREGFFLHIRHRMSGFGGVATPHPRRRAALPGVPANHGGAARRAPGGQQHGAAQGDRRGALSRPGRRRGQSPSSAPRLTRPTPNSPSHS